MSVAIRVRHPLRHNWVGAITQRDENLHIALKMGNLSLTCKMAEFRATHPFGEGSAWSEGLGVIIIMELKISYLALQLTNRSHVTTDL